MYFSERGGEEYWTLQKYFLEEEVQRELSDITVTNRKQKRKITSCNVNLKGRREDYAFNYDSTSLSGRLNSTRKSLIINAVIPEKYLLISAYLIDSGWQWKSVDKNWTILLHRTSKSHPLPKYWMETCTGFSNVHLSFPFYFSFFVLAIAFPLIFWQKFEIKPVSSSILFPFSLFCLLLAAPC